MKEYVERESAVRAVCAGCTPALCSTDCDTVASVKSIPAADVVEAGYKVFAEWVARIIFNGGLEDESFCELACRKLNDLGIVEKTENEWHFDDPCKNITPAYLVETRHKEDTQ